MKTDRKAPETYFIRATIAIQVVNDKPKISITPCSDFIMPGNSKKAIAFPAPNADVASAPAPDAASSNAPETAIIIELTDGKKDFDAEKIKEHIPPLIAVAAQQKKIEIRLEYTEDKPEMEIVGFVFPAP